MYVSGYHMSMNDLIAPMGKGSFAEIIRCTKNGKQYVAKRIFLKRNISRKLKDLIYNEHKLMKDLNQITDHVVTVYELLEEKDFIYIFMDYYNGGDLEKYMEKNKMLSEKEIKDLLAPVVETLCMLHERNIYHRDLKLSNILLHYEEKEGYEGTRNSPIVKLADFGLSTKKDRDDEKAETFCGTPLYMVRKNNVISVI